MTAAQAFQLALEQHQGGHLREAVELYRKILAAEPNHAGARHFLGVAAHQSGRHEEAAQWMEQSVALRPDEPTYQCNLGEVYRAMNRPEAATTAYRRALALQPRHAQARLNLANMLREQGELGQSESECRQAIERDSASPVAWLMLGNVLRERGDSIGAIGSYERALELQPNFAEAANNLGVVLKKLGRMSDAEKAYRLALEAKPEFTEGWNNLGIVLREQGRLPEAEAALRRALTVDGNYAEAWLSLGVVQADAGLFAEAAASCRRAIQLKPPLVGAYLNLGSALLEQGKPDEAIAVYQSALAVPNGRAGVLVGLGNAFKSQGRLDEAVAAFRQATEAQHGFLPAYSNLIYALEFHPAADSRSIAEEQARWMPYFGESSRGRSSGRDVARDPNKRLRIGYVSPDFRDHVIGRNLLPLFKRHDHRTVEVYCYSGVMRPDDLTRQFREKADRWYSTLGVSDEALAEIIREDGVDILVDLAQHLDGNRLSLFALQPAPVQVSFAGYPSGTGLEAIACRISDRYLEGAIGDQPSELGAGLQSMERLYLIESFWCYDPLDLEVPINALPALANGWVTFGSLNNFCKTNETVLRLWAGVLREVPDSRLVLMTVPGSHRERTLALFEQEGICRQRISFVPPQPREAYLQLYQGLDIVLDPFPYNGHTTSLDALWMGVPVISRVGERAVSRAGLSQLTNIGLPELATFSDEDYVRVAVGLARNLDHLKELRRTLRETMHSSVLMDAGQFARSIESAYRQMWQDWCRR